MASERDTDSGTVLRSGFFVGRWEELRQTEAALQETLKGRGSVMLLAGPPGIGKTRLAQEIAAVASHRNIAVHWGRCLEEPGAPAYWPWRQLFRSYLRNDEARGLGSVPDADRAIIAAAIPEIGKLYEQPVPHRRHIDTAQARFELFDAITRFWQQAAQQHPIMLVFDDLHCADATSVRMLAFLAAQLSDNPLMVLGSYRETDLSADHPLADALADLVRSSGFRRLHLKGLSCQESGQFFAAASGAVPSAELARAIHERTEGNPLFLQETVRLLIEGHQRGGAWQPAEPVLLTTIPEGVRDVIGRRVRRLSAAARRLLSIAACIGRTFEVDLLLCLAAKEPEERVLSALEEALHAKLLETMPEKRLLRFSHVLIRDMLYNETLLIRRIALHRAIGEWLEAPERGERAPRLPQLAYHFAEAARHGCAGKALNYARGAAAQAAQSFAYEQASRLYRLALNLQREHFCDDVTMHCDLLLTLARVEADIGAFEASRAAFLEAADVAQNHRLAAQFARAAIGFEHANYRTARSGERSVALLVEALAQHEALDPLRVELLACLCRAYVYSNHPGGAKQVYGACVQLARELGEPRGLYLALTSIASAVYWPDLLHERLAAGAEAWSIAQASSELRWTLADLMAYRLCDLLRIGDMRTLRVALDADRRVSQEMHLLYHQAVVLCFETLLSINNGAFAQAERHAGNALAIGERIAQDLASTAYGMQMFCIRREQGRLREVLPGLQHIVRTTPGHAIWRPGIALIYAELDMRMPARTEFDALGIDEAWGKPNDAASMTLICFAAEVCVYLEDVPRAEVLYRMLQPYEGTTLLADIGGPCLGSADRLLGMLAAVGKRWEVAERHFLAALEMDEHTGSRVWLAHGRYRYALMLHARGAAEDYPLATRLLADALADAAAFGMQTLAARISALGEVLAAVSAEPAYPCGLTRREVDVLRLIAIGRNNRDIGCVLNISSNTVANHVRSILEKTYTANRTEAAAFANHAGLLDA